MFPLYFFLLVLPTVSSVYFQITRFEPDPSNILCLGDAVVTLGAIEMNQVNYADRVDQAIYAKRVPLWDPDTGKLTDFRTHFSFLIDTQGVNISGHGLAFFLAPVGFEIQTNSAGGYLGLFNTSTYDSAENQIVLVEFDSFANPEWDPPVEHVGINNNTIASTV